MLALNICSGQRRFGHGWTNVDVAVRPGQVPDICADGRALPFRDSSAATVVIWHGCEHFHLGEADGLVRESHRVLAPGGCLIVAVPDLKALARRWLLGQIDDYIMMVNTYGAWQGLPGDDHHWGFSQDSLLAWLRQFGWHRVVPWDGQQLPQMDATLDWWMASAMCVKGMEAVK